MLQALYSISATKQQMPNEYLDDILGPQWDLLPARSVNECDYVVKYMKFAEVTSLLTRIIRIKIKGTTGNFASDPHYRTVIAANSQNFDLYIE